MCAGTRLRWAAPLPAARKDLDEVTALSRQHGQSEPIEHWDLAFWAERLREARYDFQITDLKKLGCQPTNDTRLGYICMVEVKATVAGQPAIERRIRGRFVADSSRWFARDVQILDAN